MIKTLSILNPETDEVMDTIPVRISYIVLKKTQLKTKKTLAQATDTDFDLYEELLWQSYEEGSRVMTIEKKYKRTQMEEVLDSCYQEFLAVIPQFFAEKPNPQGGAKK